MASPSFDTFSAARALEAAGVERSQAETIASAIAHNGDFATNHDVRGLKSDFSGLKSEFSGLKSEFSGLKSEFSGLKSEFSGLRSEFSGLRSEFKADLSNLEARMYRALWIQGGAIVGIIAALNLLA
ncbi:MAG: hypothetical protein OXI15_21245 [Chromatiales bacterium]|nr:hypothetical protein [Chromatiales bacterium]